jgi:putative peptide maturation dehydrogenase
LNVRRSAHVVLTWDSGHAEAFSPLTGERIPLTTEQISGLLEIPQDEFVACDEEWAEDLCRLGLLLSDGSDRRSVELRRRDEAIEELGWDFESVVFHLSKRAEGFHASMAPPAPRGSPVFKDLEQAATVELPLSEPSSELHRVLLARRTCREFDPDGVLTIGQLSTLLRYVWGAHAYRPGENGVLLAKTSPSGGSLHPLEAYALLARVHGVDPGLYHYSVRTHALELVESIEPGAVRELALAFTAGQDWFSDAQAFFLVTARFERSFAKYRQDPGAYQSLLLEAGHFSQTFSLVATELGLGPFVTSVINHVDIDRRLGLDPYREGVLAICGCGVPASPEVVHPEPFVPRATELEA